jgi:hypothetical protein
MVIRIGAALGWVGLCGIFVDVTAALGQVTVQSPRWGQFQSRGGLALPNGGAGHLGGARSMGSGAQQSGVLPLRPWQNRSSAGWQRSSGVVVSATAYSLRQLEAELMGTADGDGGSVTRGSNSAARAGGGKPIDLGPIDLRPIDLGPIDPDRQRKARSELADSTLADQRTEDAKADVRWARQFAADGNWVLADHFYRRAIRSLPPDLARLASQEHARLPTRSR